MAKKISQFEDMELWQLASDIAVDVFVMSETGRLSKDFGSRDQIRRASFSISSNIAEGFEYNNNKQFLRYLTYAKGSCGEVRSQLGILKRVGYVSEEKYKDLHPRLMMISQQIANFAKYLKEFEKKKKLGN